ncbi:MAG: ABC transporter permease [Clostridia bacterium]|nr:ABC transporter permease [Clostridia bacterium]
MEISMIIKPLLETIQMVVISTGIATLLGIPIGIGLILFDQKSLKANKGLYQLISGLINITRSIPFLILMILLFPVSRLIVGTTIGTAATIVPLSLAAAPFMGRIVEGALKEVPYGLIEAVLAMGAKKTQIIFKVLIPEALPGLVRGITLMMINLVGYSAMAGAIGGGGLGDLAIRYGYHRYQMDVLILAVIVIIGLVAVIQSIGNLTTKVIERKR